MAQRMYKITIEDELSGQMSGQFYCETTEQAQAQCREHYAYANDTTEEHVHIIETLDLTDAPLIEQLKQFLGLTDKDIETRYSDVYVRYSARTDTWLKNNYEFYANIKPFRGLVDGQTWLDIPFANADADFKARHKHYNE